MADRFNESHKFAYSKFMDLSKEKLVPQNDRTQIYVHRRALNTTQKMRVSLCFGFKSSNIS